MGRRILLNSRESNRFNGDTQYKSGPTSNLDLSLSLQEIAGERPRKEVEDDFEVAHGGCLAALPQFSAWFSFNRFCQLDVSWGAMACSA
jgi:hypothetical protein